MTIGRIFGQSHLFSVTSTLYTNNKMSIIVLHANEEGEDADVDNEESNDLEEMEVDEAPELEVGDPMKTLIQVAWNGFLIFAQQALIDIMDAFDPDNEDWTTERVSIVIVVTILVIYQIYKMGYQISRITE